MKSNYKSLSLSAIATLFVGGVFMAGCGSGGGDNSGTTGNATTGTAPPVTGDTIKIGVVASLNGDLKPWGVDSEAGAKLAEQEINDAGGINGKKIELVVADSNSTPEQGKTAATGLIDKGCVAIVGEVASGITAQIANAAEAKKIPVVAVGATKTDLPGIGQWVARVCYVDDLQGPVMATFAYEELGLRNVALVTDNKQPYSTYLSNTFRDSFVKQGGKIVDEQF
jgi:branched-chain amino acid transport system substrate-binding protein